VNITNYVNIQTKRFGLIASLTMYICQQETGLKTAETIYKTTKYEDIEWHEILYVFYIIIYSLSAANNWHHLIKW